MYVVEKVRLIHWMNSRDGYEQVLCTCLFCLWFRRTKACSIDEENPMLRAAIARPATCVAPSTVWNLNAAYEKTQAALVFPCARGVRCRHFAVHPYRVIAYKDTS